MSYHSNTKTGNWYDQVRGIVEIDVWYFFLLLLGQPAGAIANTTTTAAPSQEKQKSPASAPRSKTRVKKGKGKGKAKPEPPEETDPRKLELIRWVGIMKFMQMLHVEIWDNRVNIEKIVILYIYSIRWTHWSRLWWMLWCWTEWTLSNCSSRMESTFTTSSPFPGWKSYTTRWEFYNAEQHQQKGKKKLIHRVLMDKNIQNLLLLLVLTSFRNLARQIPCTLWLGMSKR